jgi:putative MATE family efflux protein
MTITAGPEPSPGPDELLRLAPMSAIIRLALPTTGVMVIATLSNVLHTYYVSRLGTDAIAAVALVFPISLLSITVMAGGVGAGAASAIARALGASRIGAAVAVAESSISLALGIGLCFAAVILVGAPRVFALMGGRGNVLDLAVLYARVLFGGAAITFVASMLDSIMRGEGNVRVPAVWASISLMAQIVLTPFLMFTVGLGLVGAPVAMLTCQLGAALPRARYVFSGGGIVRPTRLLALHRTPLREILRVGIPASLATSVNYIGIMILTGLLARFGDAHLGAYGLATRMDFLLLSFAYGFGGAVLTLVGMATGARQPARAKTYVLRAGLLIVSLLALAGGALWWRPGWWIGLFTADAAIHAVGGDYFRVIGPSYPFMGVSMVIAFAFQGLGRATIPLLMMTARMVAVLAAAILSTRWLGASEHAIFLAIAAGNVVSALVMATLFAHFQRGLATELDGSL